MVPDSDPATRWQYWIHAAGSLLAVVFFLHLLRYDVTELLQATFWTAHSLVDVVPQVGTARMTELVSVGLWLLVVLVFAVFLVGLSRIPSEAGDDNPVN